MPFRLAERLAHGALGSAKKREIELFYAGEIELFRHTYLPRPWIEGEGNECVRVDEHEVDVVNFDLRRYEHAIDKGLQLPDRRPGFGKERIRCLFRMMATLSTRENRCGAVANTVGILRRYRRVLDEDLSSEALPEQARKELREWASELDGVLSHYSESICPVPEAPSYDGLSPALFERKSIRRWSDRKVSRDTLKVMVDAALWSPASCNRQPYVFLFIEDQVKKDLVVNTATGAKGFAERAPVICMLLNDVRAYYGPCERHLVYIDTALAAGNLTLAAHELGVGTVWLNWALPDARCEQAVRDALGIKPWHAIVALIAIGYPDEASEVRASIRRSVDDVIAFDELGEAG